MRIYLIFTLIAVYAVQEIQGVCEEFKQLELTCGSYCFKALGPILDHSKLLQSRVDERESSNNIEKMLQSLTDIVGNKFSLIEQKIDEHIKKVNEELQPIKSDISLLKQKLDTLHRSEGNVDKTDYTSFQQIIEKLSELVVNIEMKPFRKIGRKFYYIENKQKLNWFQAKKKCLQLDGHLINLQNEDELKAVSTRLTEQNYWLDINDNNLEGEYISATSGKRAPFLKWNQGEPNNIYQEEDCVLLVFVNTKYLMNDGQCDSEQNFICERE